MTQKTVIGNEDLGRKIRSRRNELGLTIEEAASRAGVGTKTWYRYESGGSIRKDKYNGISKALNWRSFTLDGSEESKKNWIEEYKDHKAWSRFLADAYGEKAAVSFAAGSDILLDYIEQDLSDLASMPLDSHIGQLSTSFIKEELPAQFLMRYTYDFLYQMKCTLIQLRKRAYAGVAMTAHTVMEELAIYLCVQEAGMVVEIISDSDLMDDDVEFDFSEEWVFDMFDDMDLITFLYSDQNLYEDNSYHFVQWNTPQFYID